VTIEERLEPFSTGIKPVELARYEVESKLFDTFSLRVKDGSSYCKPENLYDDVVFWIKKAGYILTKSNKPRERLKKLGVILDDTKPRVDQEHLKTPLALAMFSLMEQLEDEKGAVEVTVEALNIEFDSDGDIARPCAYTFLTDLQKEVDIWFNISLIRLDTSILSVSAEDNPSPPMRKEKSIK